MDYRIATILVGAVFCTAGLAFAFYDSEPLYLREMTNYYWYESQYLIAYFLRAFPNFMTGLALAVGGFVIAVIGKNYFEDKTKKQ